MSIENAGRRARNRMVLIGLSTLIVIGAVVGLVVGLAARTTPQPTEPNPQGSSTPTSEPTAPTAAPSGTAVDPTVTELGLIPQPVTDNLEAYAVAAARAIVTVDSQKVTRAQYLDYLTTWLGGDPREAAEYLEARRQNTRDEISNRVIGDTDRWDSLVQSKSTITAAQTGELRIDRDHVSLGEQGFAEDLPLGIHVVSVDLIVSTTEDDGSGGRLTFDYPLTMTMQLSCGQSIPVSNDRQTPADCTVLRWFDKPFV